jgi:uncharacterized small protein (DUF1192 family)
MHHFRIDPLGLTADEILARAREKVGMTGAPVAPLEAPILFDNFLLDDMQLVLLTMERRIREGPGSLSLLEVEELDARLARITGEMRRNEHKTLPRPGVATAEEAKHNSLPQGAVTVETTRVASPQQVQTAVVMDTSQDEEGPRFDGRGGMGQPKGTVNTYIIEGMDEMDSETYRLALQQSLIDRQSKRKQGGVVGNRSTWDYLNSLTGEKGILKEGVVKDIEEKKNP